MDLKDLIKAWSYILMMLVFLVFAAWFVRRLSGDLPAEDQPGMTQPGRTPLINPETTEVETTFSEPRPLSEQETPSLQGGEPPEDTRDLELEASPPIEASSENLTAPTGTKPSDGETSIAETPDLASIKPELEEPPPELLAASTTPSETVLGVDVCPLQTVSAPAATTDAQGHFRIPSSPGAPVAAVMAGTVVKRFHSPYTGHSLYLLAENGRWCFFYGRLGAVVTDATEGRFLACGAILGKVAEKGPGPSFLFSVLDVPEGAKWGQGKAADPTPFLTPER